MQADPLQTTDNILLTKPVCMALFIGIGNSESVWCSKYTFIICRDFFDFFFLFLLLLAFTKTAHLMYHCLAVYFARLYTTSKGKLKTHWLNI